MAAEFFRGSGAPVEAGVSLTQFWPAPGCASKTKIVRHDMSLTKAFIFAVFPIKLKAIMFSNKVKR